MDEFKEKIRNLLARATNGPWKLRTTSLCDAACAEIDGGAEADEWGCFARVAIYVDGEYSSEGAANAELLWRAREFAELIVNDVAHERRIQDLLDANNAYLERARVAEAANVRLQAQAGAWAEQTKGIRDELLAILDNVTKLQQAKHRAELDLATALQENLHLHAKYSSKSDVPICETTVERLVNRFLTWELPDGYQADLCAFERNYPYPRSGTNILDAGQAKLMIEHVFAEEIGSPEEIKELGEKFTILFEDPFLTFAAIERAARALCPIDPDGTREMIFDRIWYRPGLPHWQSHIAQARAVLNAAANRGGVLA